MFLSKIRDKDYVEFVDNCMDNPSIDLEQCMTKLNAKFIRMNPGKTTSSTRQASNANVTRKKKRDKNRKANNTKSNSNNHIEEIRNS